MLHRWMGLPAETPGGRNAAFRFIYKRLQMPGILFSGMFFVSMGGTALVWTIVDGERGAPGLRQAVIGTEMWSSGKLNGIEDFERQWPQDPYDMLSVVVDSRVGPLYFRQ
jgi:hypothetical protein